MIMEEIPVNYQQQEALLETYGSVRKVGSQL
jgi:hypothetical protein